MSIILGTRSLSRLHGVHPDLVRVVKKAASMSDLDFTVLEGLRTVERQKQLFAQKATKTMNSRHITGHAVDLAPVLGGEVSWDWPLYNRLAKIVKAAAVAENVSITWGGDWRTFKDGPHWELPWKQYPKGN
jgi:peptidoglycan L-alanyl-D-glutamate endopeptidase CwlK